MSESESPASDDPSTEADPDQVQAQLNIFGQYIKDMSFENPNAPAVLHEPVSDAHLEFKVDVEVNNLKENEFEVDLSLGIMAKHKEMTLYNFELVYSGVFRLTNIPQNSLKPVLFVTCPAMLFPFVRRLAVDTIRDGGFPPPMLDPIDFASLYQEQAQSASRGNGGSEH